MFENTWVAWVPCDICDESFQTVTTTKIHIHKPVICLWFRYCDWVLISMTGYIGWQELEVQPFHLRIKMAFSLKVFSVESHLMLWDNDITHQELALSMLKFAIKSSTKMIKWRLIFHWKSSCDSCRKCSSHNIDLRDHMQKNLKEAQ